MKRAVTAGLLAVAAMVVSAPARQRRSIRSSSRLTALTIKRLPITHTVTQLKCPGRPRRREPLRAERSPGNFGGERRGVQRFQARWVVWGTANAIAGPNRRCRPSVLGRPRPDDTAGHGRAYPRLRPPVNPPGRAPHNLGVHSSASISSTVPSVYVTSKYGMGPRPPRGEGISTHIQCGTGR
jgi:hypothetical protein